MPDKRIAQIRACEDQIRKLAGTPENQRRAALWSEHSIINDYNWHPHPISNERMPYSFEIERVGYAQMLGFDLVRFYTDPVEFLLRQLEISIFKFETFPEDCSPIGKAVTYWPGVGYEASLMGLPQQYSPQDSWVGTSPVIKERLPLGEILFPDFHDSPAMRETHRFYRVMREILSDDFELYFPQWCRSPWSVAWAIRGLNALMMDYADDPYWLSGFVDLLADYRIRWSRQRADFLGRDFAPANFYNDEVTSPVVSPDMYREIILPSEIKISAAFGGIAYWHSCGNTDPYMRDIDTIPNLTMVHVAPWSDVRRAAITYAKDKIIEVALHPLSDVMAPRYPARIDERIIEAKEATASHPSVLRADGFVVLDGDVAGSIAKLRHWIDRANKLLL